MKMDSHWSFDNVILINGSLYQKKCS